MYFLCLYCSRYIDENDEFDAYRTHRGFFRLFLRKFLQHAYLDELHIICVLPIAFEAIRDAFMREKAVVRRIARITITAQHFKFAASNETGLRFENAVRNQLDKIIKYLVGIGFIYEKNVSVEGQDNSRMNYDLIFSNPNRQLLKQPNIEEPKDEEDIMREMEANGYEHRSEYYGVHDKDGVYYEAEYYQDLSGNIESTLPCYKWDERL